MRAMGLAARQKDGWRNIAISLVDMQKGEEKAHTSAIA